MQTDLLTSALQQTRYVTGNVSNNVAKLQGVGCPVVGPYWPD